MNRLLRATTLIGRPVVTLAGESPFEVKDIVFDTGKGEILGFTLREHGFFGSPVEETLTWADVHGIGPDAVVVADEGAFVARRVGGPGGDVIEDRVITESGTDLGEVVEVIIEAGHGADVVGFEMEPNEALADSGRGRVFIPLPDTLAVSDEKIVVPDAAVDYVRDDLAGFGGAVEQFRNRLSEES